MLHVACCNGPACVPEQPAPTFDLGAELDPSQATAEELARQRSELESKIKTWESHRYILKFARPTAAGQPGSTIFVSASRDPSIRSTRSVAGGHEGGMPIFSTGLVLQLSDALTAAGLQPLRPRPLTSGEKWELMGQPTPPTISGALMKGSELLPQLETGISTLEDAITRLNEKLAALPTEASTTTMAPAPSAKRGLSTGAKIGIGVGVGVVLIGGMIAAFAAGRRART